MTENKKGIVSSSHTPGTNEIKYTVVDGSTGTTTGTAADSIKMVVDSQRVDIMYQTTVKDGDRI